MVALGHKFEAIIISAFQHGRRKEKREQKEKAYLSIFQYYIGPNSVICLWVSARVAEKG